MAENMKLSDIMEKRKLLLSQSVNENDTFTKYLEQGWNQYIKNSLRTILKNSLEQEELLQQSLSLILNDYLKDPEKIKNIASSAVDNANKAEKIAEQALATATNASRISVAVPLEEHFKNRHADLAKPNKRWLIATGLLAVTTIISPILYNLFFSFGDPRIDIPTKIIIFSTLLTSTLWCGKIFKSIHSQRAIYEDKRALTKTYLAFINAAGDDKETKNVVLQETVKTIFSPLSPGLVHDGVAGDEKGVVEIIKSMK